MSLNPFPTQPITPERKLNFAHGVPDVDEAVGVTMEAYRLLDALPEDHEQAREYLQAQFGSMVDLDIDGRLYFPLASPSEAHDGFSTERILEVTEEHRADCVGTAYRYHNLWTPGHEDYEVGGYAAEELDSGPQVSVARLAVFSSLADPEIADPTLHYLDLPYDDEKQKKDHHTTTQLDELESDIELFKSMHPNFTLQATGLRDYLLLALMDRIRGKHTDNSIDPESIEFILNRGFMRTVSPLGRRELEGGSFVGRVYSSASRLYLGGSDGYALPGIGLGLSVGLAADK